MDLETENRLATLLMQEARRLRCEAEKGVHVYLEKPNVRGRPNSQFLTATVLGVQQANRVVEVSEMWHAREKELEFDAKITSRAKGKRAGMVERCHENASRVRSTHEETRRGSGVHSSSKLDYEDCQSAHSSDDAGLRDEEVEQFLHSRAKRGRGGVGSRMSDVSSASSNHNGQHMESTDTRVKERWEEQILGQEKTYFARLSEDRGDAKAKKSSEKHCHKRRSEKEKARKTKKKERHSKHHHRRRSE